MTKFQLLLPACLLASLLVCKAGAADPFTAADIISRAETRYRALSDYQCVVDTTTHSAGKSEERSYQLWYRQPGLLRVKVLRGRARGSEVVVNQKGQIHGRKAGLLKAIVVRLSPSDDRVCNLRGVPVTEFNPDTFFKGFRERLARPGAKLSLATPPGAPVQDVVLTYVESGRKMREVYRIHRDNWTLAEREMYENGVLVDEVVFREMKLNTGVEERHFRL